MRIVVLIKMCMLLLACSYHNMAPAERPHDTIHFQCKGPRNGKPPEKFYSCSIDILAPAAHERWLIIPSMMEATLEIHQVVAMMEMRQTLDGISYCGSLHHPANFEAVQVPAGSRLHLENWRIETMEDRHALTVWLGTTPRLSTGETLSDVCSRLISTVPDATGAPPSGDWQAPKGTALHLDPAGFHHVQLNSVAR